MLIGIFDSGIGGEAVANKLAELLPKANLIVVNDCNNVPYGSKEPEEIISLTKSAIQPLIKANCDVIVIACNTATTVAISELRSIFPNKHFVGIEPMIKPAALLTKTKHIAVCATPRTIESARYKELKKTWSKGIDIIEPDCSNWASLIEQGKSSQINLENLVKSLTMKNVDVIVLGCTHFHWLKQRILDIDPKMEVLEPSDSIAGRIRDILSATDY